jgi:hypothetical protein
MLSHRPGMTVNAGVSKDGGSVIVFGRPPAIYEARDRN